MVCFACAQLSINVDKTNGRFSISVEDTDVVDGMDIFVMHMGKKYSVSDGGLKLMKQLDGSGADDMGKWTEVAFHWQLTGTQPPIMFRTSIISYKEHSTITFIQVNTSSVTIGNDGECDNLCVFYHQKNSLLATCPPNSLQL